MKILHIGLMVNGRGEGLSKAFKDVCTDYLELSPSIRLPYEINAITFMPDIVFIQIQDEKIRDGRNEYPTEKLLQPTIDRLRKLGAYIINWTGDKRDHTPQWMLNFKVDCVAFSNMEDVNVARSRGLKSEFLQIGIDPEVFNNSYKKINVPNIVFMGNAHGRYPLSQFRQSVVSALTRRYGGSFGVWGHGYQGSRGSLNADGNNPFPMQSKESQIYGSAKIGISISHYDSERYTSDRLLRIMGSGCMALSHDFKGIDQDFSGKLAKFTDMNDLFSKIDYYLEHESERAQLAKTGYEFIHSNHTYANMVQYIIKLKG